MYIAELHGKFSPQEERMEDILTSDVFSFFKYANREIFLHELLRTLGLDVCSQDLAGAEFNFWPSYEDGTQPDLVIIVGEYYLLFEAKLTSSFGRGTELSKYQLIREFENGRDEAQNQNKTFHLIAVTAHYSKHKFLEDIHGYFDHEILWINWHQIALIIERILNENNLLELELRCMAKDLTSLLVKKNLRKFAGYQVFDFKRLLQKTDYSLFFDAKTAQFRGDFLGFEEVLKPITELHLIKRIFFDKYNRRLFDFVSENELLQTPNLIFYKR